MESERSSRTPGRSLRPSFLSLSPRSLPHHRRQIQIRRSHFVVLVSATVSLAD
ncbi:hypothetical protein RchiOBHm_Chr7g0177541 [Rosa chinensis]|uniref:Uncharacterized protein n=1 Tax=Rosa chinensis TaxID=74649 RepID=A0A2P6P1K2_ROSCH|nr:hypothetical protein RchiOBHm_Chr7g0177541 [Rosa chinensis]